MSFDKMRRIKMILKKPPGFKILLIVFPVAIIVGIGCAQKIKPLVSTPIGVKVAALSPKLSSAYAGILEVLLAKDIKIEINSLPNVGLNASITPQWNILDKLSEKEDELALVPISTDSKEINYYDSRISFRADGTPSVTRKRFSDRERVIGLKLLNTETGEVEVIKASTKITTNGVSLVAPAGYQIEIAERPNGIRWNLWNTLYRVTTPKNTVVIKNLFPREVTETVSRVVKGKVRKESRKVVMGFLYVPHSEFFEEDENSDILVDAGVNRVKNVVSQAFAILGDRNVMSRAIPGTLVSDVKALDPRFFERLPLLEQGDLTEFTFNPEKTAKRTLIILGANGEDAWRYTCNWVDACGWVQFTPRTYRTIRTTYPAAKLMVNFKDGAGDQLNSIMAAILLHDYNLNGLVDRYGNKILIDPRLEEYLAASYNGSPTHVYRSLTATLGKNVADWTKYLKSETHGFMFKLRYLIKNDLP